MKKLYIFLLIIFIIYFIIYRHTNSNISDLGDISETSDIKIIDKKYLTGVNVWTYYNALEVLIDIGKYEDLPSDKIPGFYQNIIDSLPSLKYHECCGGFLERIKKGTYMAHILEHIILELQNFSDVSKGKGRTRETEKRGIYKMVVSDEQEDLECISECLDCGLDFLKRLLKGEKNIAIYPYHERIRKVNLDKSFGSNIHIIIDALDQIPYFKISSSGSFIQLGYGKYQRRLWISTTDKTVGIAESIVSNKDFTKKLLNQQGISTPDRNIVKNDEELENIVRNYKNKNNIVIKPSNSNHGRGITLDIDINNINNIKKAYYNALENNKNNSKDVIIENFIKGDCYRILILNHRPIACCRCFLKTFSEKITGNGTDTIEDLVNNLKSKLFLDNCYNYKDNEGNMYFFTNHYFKKHMLIQYLNEQSLTMSDIPEKGVDINLILTYDQYKDVDISTISPFIIEKCSLATKIVGLDLCGIDIIIPELGLEKKEYTILELNSGTDLRIHKDSKINVAKEIINYLFPSYYYFPMIGITGEGDRSFVNRFISSFLNRMGWIVGSYGEKGLFIGEKQSKNTYKTYPENIKKVLMNNSIDAAIFDQNYDIINNYGIGYRYANAIILGKINNIEYDSSTLIQEPPNTLKTLRTQLDIVSRDGYSILNGNDPQLENLEKFVDNKENIIYYFITSEPIYISNNNSNKVYYSHINNKITVSSKKGKSFFIDITNLTDINNINTIAAIAGLWSIIDITNVNIRNYF